MRKCKKLLSVFLAVCMLMTMFVLTTQQTAFAAGGDGFVTSTCTSTSVDKSSSSTAVVSVTFNKVSQVSWSNTGTVKCNNQTGSPQPGYYTSTNSYGGNVSFTISSWDVGDYQVDAYATVAAFGQTRTDHAYGTITVTCSHSNGHTKTVSTVAATCTEGGYTNYKCDVCGATWTGNATSALGHSFTSQTTTSTYLKSAATCTSAAVYYYKCSRCTASSKNNTNTTYASGSANGHTPGAAATCTTAQTCTVCGATIAPATGHTEVTDAAVAPTCTATGLTQGSHCSACNTVIVAQETVPATGHTEVTDAAVAPTCTETGLTQGSHCSVCNTVLVAQETVPATGHTEVTDAAVAPTCTETGLTQGSHCSVCNTVIVAQEVVPATGHAYGEWTVTTPATCTTTGVETRVCANDANHTETREIAIDPTNHDFQFTRTVAPTCTTAGYDIYTCSRCDATENRNEVATTGHKVVVDAAVAPTCTETGLTEGSHCSVCNTVLVAQETVPATGHAYGEWTVTTPATCTATGVETRVCANDANHTETRDIAIDPNNHDFVFTRTVAPTCTEAGYDIYTCTRCEATENRNEVPATGHAYGEWTVTTPATCSATGVETRVCANDANHTETRDIAIDPNNHDFVFTRTVAPTCTEAGYDIYTCSRCEATEHRNEVEATGHAYGEWTVTTPATCTATGVETRVCANDANHTETRDIAIDPNNHDFVFTRTVAPTCTTAGYDIYTCSRCDATENRNEVATTGHAYGEWIVTTPATCTATGVETRVCANDANHTETRDIAIDENAHAYGEWTVTTPATCTATGVETRVCANDANHTETRDIAIDPNNHDFQFTRTVAPTCTEAGYDIYTCSRCEATENRNEVEATGHTWDEGTITTEPTTTTAGVMTYTCTVCKETKTESIPVLGIEECLRLINATAEVKGSTITISLLDSEKTSGPGIVPKLSDGALVSFSNLTGGAAISKNGTLYARTYGTATATINGVDYTVVFDMPEETVVPVELIDTIKYENATAQISEKTITLTPEAGATCVKMYPTLKDGSAVTFTELSEKASVSKNGTLSAKYYATATAIIGGEEYTVILDMPEEPAKPELTLAEKLNTSNANVSVEGTTITLTAIDTNTVTSIYPTLKGGETAVFSEIDGASISKSGTLYAKNYATATLRVGGEDYTVVFDLAQLPTKTIADVIRVANADVSFDGTTITLTAKDVGTHISVYTTTKDGDDVTFSELNSASVSKSGTCFAKTNASCTATVNGEQYNIVFVF